jgi:uncharacterized surface anchored protein
VTITANATTGTGKTTTTTATNVWKYWSATVTKVDADTSVAQGDASLDGAEYTLYQSGKAVATYTVKNGKFVTDSYPCYSSNSVYYLKETKAPEGYILDTTKHTLTTSYTTLTKAENSISVTVSDIVIKGQIQLEKWAVNSASGDKQPEQGATFQVWLKSAGSYNRAKVTEKDVITIGEDGTGISKELPYGTYCIQQATGWDGYDLDTQTYEVTISEDGVTMTKDNDGNDLVLYNYIQTGSLTIYKVDGDTKDPLAGAEFTLTGSDGSSVTQTTDDDGKAVFEGLAYGVTYTWTETQAPYGYQLDEANTGTWSLENKADETEITCENFRIPGSFTVTKQNADGEPLSGCTFLLEYLDGTEWKPVTARSSDPIAKGGCTSPNLENGCLTTDESGTVTFAGLWADFELQYRLTEVAAPEGYELLSEPVYEGVLPLGYPASKVTAEPDVLIGESAYFYNLPITVRDGKIYTLPTTGGGNFPFVPLGILALCVGSLLILNHKHPYIFNHMKKNIRRYFA